MVELEVEDKPNMDLSQAGVDINLGEIMGGMMPKKTKIRKLFRIRSAPRFGTGRGR